MSALTIGTRRTTIADGYRYTGQLRVGRTVLAECGHEHDNRNHTTKTSGESATDCMTMALRATNLPALRESRAADYRNAWQRLLRGPFAVSAATIEAAKTDGARNADQFEALVDQLAAVLHAHGLRVDTSSLGARLVPNLPIAS